MEVLELIRIFATGSFFNLWYWIFVAIFWSRITYTCVGVPLHDVRYAYRNPEKGMADFETLMSINVRRQNEMFETYGVGLVAFYFFILAAIITMGVVYDFEFMYALMFLWGFGGLATALSIRFSLWLADNPIKDAALVKAYFRHQRAKQFVGLFAMTCTSMFGMVYLYF